MGKEISGAYRLSKSYIVANNAFQKKETSRLRKAFWENRLIEKMLS